MRTPRLKLKITQKQKLQEYKIIKIRQWQVTAVQEGSVTEQYQWESSATI